MVVCLSFRCIVNLAIDLYAKTNSRAIEIEYICTITMLPTKFQTENLSALKPFPENMLAGSLFSSQLLAEFLVVRLVRKVHGFVGVFSPVISDPQPPILGGEWGLKEIPRKQERLP